MSKKTLLLTLFLFITAAFSPVAAQGNSGADTVYAALDYRFKDTGHKNIFLGTVEAYPALDSLLRAADSFHPKKIVLAPFMIVAGDHAQNDLAGADPDSWMNRLSSEGYEVTPVLKGLGEYPQVRQILVEHVQQAMNASI